MLSTLFPLDGVPMCCEPLMAQNSAPFGVAGSPNDALLRAHQTSWSTLERESCERALRDLLAQRQWAAAALVLTRGFALFEREKALHLALTPFEERTAQRVIGACMLGRSLRDHRQEGWSQPPQANLGYFKALQPQFLATLSFHLLSWNLPSEALLPALQLAHREGFDLGGESARQLALEAARLGRSDVLDWIREANEDTSLLSLLSSSALAHAVF